MPRFGRSKGSDLSAGRPGRGVPVVGATPMPKAGVAPVEGEGRRPPWQGQGGAPRGLQVLGVEGEDLLPAVVGGLYPVGRAVDGEEGVASVRVAVELVGLAVGLQGRLELGDVLRRR